MGPMNQTKIAFLSVFYPYRGGIAQFNNELYQALSPLATLQAYNFKRQYPSLLFPGKTQLVSAKDPNPGIDAPALLDSINPISYYQTAKSIREFAPDVLLTSYWMPFFAPSLGKTIQQVKAKKISVLHNVIPHEKRKFDETLNKYFLKQNDAFIVLSDTVKNQLLHYYPKAKYLQIPHPVYNHFGEKLDKVQAKQNLGISPNRKVILFFGFIRKYKGLDILIKSLSNIQEPYTLLIAGESYDDFTEYQNLLNENGIVGEKLCSKVEYVTDDDVKKYFSASDICALPYRSATQSGIAAVAKHFEVPMVVTPVGELPNEVKHLKTGFICQDSNPESFAFGIQNVMINHSIYSQNMFQDNQDNTWQNFAKKLMDFI